mmetsp:Transcript_23355/g.27595  ORF Transcript_23355/g.27595 Transcript_23355/m.27595 type:complete len:85 (+) Transcript_23355:141-395(+)|eukprot:CAMPEP_0198252758 /NCGR_PEP_ID=MMETSP1447-20131203/3235_1 /TAXON_ID=420782 /ORGANISM="Chaetoceros dichaeta, Strain CCMP1751" /LENGTH=84 /DNA_ID=CAMNT_0043938135 /DNA_START=217 /DNA_END=468 /DNA_ORIENTATION=-
MVDAVKDKNDIVENNPPAPAKATPLQIGLGLMIVGASAGMTLYTKKTGAMLAQLERAKRNKEIRMPTKYGPPTKKEWDKLRPRW